MRTSISEEVHIFIFQNWMSEQTTVFNLLPDNVCITEKIIAYSLSVNTEYTRGFPKYLDEYQAEKNTMIHMTLFSFDQERSDSATIMFPGEKEFRSIGSMFEVENVPDEVTDIAVFWVQEDDRTVKIIGNYFVKGDNTNGFDCVCEAKKK